MWSLIAVLLFTSGTHTAGGPEAGMCSVGALRSNPDGYFWPVDSVRNFIDSAAAIVRAEAVAARYAPENPGRYAPRSSVLTFEVVELLKGEVPGAELTLRGHVADEDDFNRGSVPYQMVRPSGQHGDCFATQYRLGGEYLLIMTIDRDGDLSPYWKALAPMNEQIRGPEDPWLVWVRNQVAGG